jgi:acyl-CoA synthetase (AMP-forming)/AMP-acid ligase II
MIEFGKIYKNESGEDVKTEIEEKDIAFILYTAGTTGRPKGVLLSHSNWIWTATNAALDADVQSGDRALLVFPLYHAGAILILTVNLYMGCSNVTTKSFDPERVMELIEKEKITRMAFPPTVWNFILQIPNLDRHDTSSVRYIGSGGESMPLETKKKLLKLFFNAGLGETYGMTEAGTVSILNPKFALTKMASVGKTTVNSEIRLINSENKDVSAGEVGEILVRGPCVMAGYYKDHEATSHAIRDGWLHTGDFGRLDGDGFLYIVDRKKDMIITGGENVYPREIEEVLYRHPKILEAAVIGLPDPMWGEKIHAVVALKDGESLTEQEVINYAKENLSSFKKLKSIGFVDRLPRSPTGKVLKYVLRKREKSSF